MDKVSVVTLSAAKSYTDESIAGGGAIKGKNCQIKSKTDITGGTRIVFAWYLDNGTEQTTTMDVMDGEQGVSGVGVKGVTITEANHLVLTLTDDSTVDAGELTDLNTSIDHITDVSLNNLADGQILQYNATSRKWENTSPGAVSTSLTDLSDVDIDNVSDGQIIVWDATNNRWVNADNAPTITVDSVPTEGSTNAVSSGGTYTALAGKADRSAVPTATSDLTNDSGFITNLVNDLANYYAKSQTYTKTEVDSLISAISTIHFEVVSVLPTSDIQTNVIYLVPSDDPETSNVKDEYINLDGTTAGWEKIGTTDIDLSDYVTTTDLATTLASYVTSSDLTTILAGYAQTSSLGTAAALDVATSGDASSTQVVKGDDSRLTDSRTPTAHNQASNTINAMTGYEKASSVSAITTSDTLNQAIGKLEKAIETSEGPITRYNIVTKSTGSMDAAVTIKKYVDNTLISSTDYLYSQLENTITVDGCFTLNYGEGYLSYTYKLLRASTTHAAAYQYSWDYSTTVDISDSFTPDYVTESELQTALSNYALTSSLGTAAALDVAASGDASSTQVVKGDDSRLSASTDSKAGTMSASDKSKLDGIAAGASATLSGLTDTSVSSPTNGQILKYNSTSGKWENGTDSGLPENPLAIAHGGTGNADGYIRTGVASGSTIGTGATAEGEDNTASGDYSHAERSGSSAEGECSHVEGMDCYAEGDYSHAEGAFCCASGETSHAEGGSSRATGRFSHAEGTYYSCATGNPDDDYTTASGEGSHAEGAACHATGYYAHAEGLRTVSSGGNGSHSEGYWTTASGSNAHSEGYKTTASNSCTHAGGTNAVASGLHSFAHGQYVNAGYAQQTAIGRYNDNKSTSLFEIGNGADANNRSNALEVDASGNVTAGGDVIDGSGNKLSEAIQWDAAKTSVKKNLLPLSLEHIKEKNTIGTWNGNIYTVGSGTFEVITDSNGLVTSIKANGTFAQNARLIVYSGAISNGNYILNKGYGTTPETNIGIGAEAYNGYTWVKALAQSYGTDDGAMKVDNDGYDSVRVSIIVPSAGSVSNLMIYPMIRLSTVTDNTFAPYILDNVELANKIDNISASAMSKTRYTIAAASWSASANASGYYTYSLTLTTLLSTSYAPNVYISGASDSTFSTDTEKAQFSYLDECNLSASNTLVLYAKTKPTSTFYVYVEGQNA